MQNHGNLGQGYDPYSYQDNQAQTKNPYGAPNSVDHQQHFAHPPIYEPAKNSPYQQYADQNRSSPNGYPNNNSANTQYNDILGILEKFFFG